MGCHKSTQVGKDVFSDLAWSCKGPVRSWSSQWGWLLPELLFMHDSGEHYSNGMASLLEEAGAVSHVRVHSHIQVLRGQVNTCAPSARVHHLRSFTAKNARMMNNRCFPKGKRSGLTSPALVYSNARLTRLPTALTSPRASPAAA